MDVMMSHCDFSQDKYVRDCLDVLRLNGGLDGALRSGNGPREWEMTYRDGDENGRQKSVGRGASAGEVERLARVGRVASVLNATEEEFKALVDVQYRLTLAGEAAPFTKFTNSKSSELLCVGLHMFAVLTSALCWPLQTKIYTPHSTPPATPPTPAFSTSSG